MRKFLSLVLAIAVVMAIVWQYVRDAGTVAVSGATAVSIANEPGRVHVFAKFSNGDTPDILEGVSSPDAQRASLAVRDGHSVLPVPAGASSVLSEDGAYVVLDGISGNLEEGRLIPIALHFRKSGQLTTQAVLGPATSPHAGHMAMTDMGADDRNEAAPSVSLSVSRATDSSWSVEIKTDNFVFDQMADEPKHIAGHGHAHLYLNGMKLQRMYGHNASIGQLPPGDYTVSVELNSNLHMPYRNGDDVVSAKQVISVD